MMKRRDFITLLGGAAAWPLALRAQFKALVEGFNALGYVKTLPTPPIGIMP